MKPKFRGIMMTFIDKTSLVVPTKKDDKEIWPKITLRVKIPGQIPPKHRICRWLYNIKSWQQQLMEELCFFLSLL